MILTTFSVLVVFDKTYYVPDTWARGGEREKNTKNSPEVRKLFSSLQLSRDPDPAHQHSLHPFDCKYCQTLSTRSRFVSLGQNTTTTKNQRDLWLVGCRQLLTHQTIVQKPVSSASDIGNFVEIFFISSCFRIHYRRLFSFLLLIPVLQIRGQRAGYSPSSPIFVRFWPCAIFARRLQPFPPSSTRIEIYNYVIPCIILAHFAHSPH